MQLICFRTEQSSVWNYFWGFDHVMKYFNHGWIYCDTPPGTICTFPRIMWHSAATWPDVDPAEIFPNKSEPVCVSTATFYTEHPMIFLIPDGNCAHDHGPAPNPEWTARLNAPAVNLSISKYTTLLRGSMEHCLHGF